MVSGASFAENTITGTGARSGRSKSATCCDRAARSNALALKAAADALRRDHGAERFARFIDEAADAYQWRNPFRRRF